MYKYNTTIMFLFIFYVMIRSELVGFFFYFSYKEFLTVGTEITPSFASISSDYSKNFLERGSLRSILFRFFIILFRLIFIACNIWIIQQPATSI